MTGLDVLPLARVVDDEKVTDHHAIIPTNAEHRLEKMSDDDRAIYDLVVSASSRSSTPRPCSRTRASRRPSPTHVFRTRGKVLIVPGWRGVYGETADADSEERRRRRGPRAAAAQARAGRGRADPRGRVAGARRPSRRGATPTRRCSAAMETAGKLVDDEELREAMKDSGIGTPATRAAIIERLIDVGYVERDGRALVADREGAERHPPARRPPADLARPDRRLGAPPGDDRARRGVARGVHGRHREVRRSRPSASSTPSSRTCASRAPTSARARSAATTSSRTARATRAGRARIPGCGFVIWKSKAGKQLPAAVARELITTGRTEKPVTGFKGRSGTLVPRAPGAACRTKRASGASSSTSRGPRRARSRLRLEVEAARGRDRPRPRPKLRSTPARRTVGTLRNHGACAAQADHRPRELRQGGGRSRWVSGCGGAGSAARGADRSATSTHYRRELAEGGLVFAGEVMRFDRLHARDRQARRLSGRRQVGWLQRRAWSRRRSRRLTSGSWRSRLPTPGFAPRRRAT